MRNRYFISFGVTEEEKAEIVEYCNKKKRWASPSDLARDAVWQLISRNKIGSHKPQNKAKNAGRPTNTSLGDKGYPGRGAVLHRQSEKGL